MMQKFIKRSLLFISSVIVLVVILNMATSTFDRKQADFTLKTKPENIILGHSHVTMAFNDALIKNTENLSETSEAYFYTYYKTQQILKHNPSIKTVFIGYTNNQITESINQWIWNTKNLTYRYPKYSSFMSFSDQFLLMKKNRSGFLNAFSVSEKNKLSNLLMNTTKNNKVYGGYISLKRNKTDSILAVNDTITIAKNSSKISEYNLEYLSKTIALCKQYNKRVILVRSPVHEKWTEYSNELQFMETLKKRYANIEFIDFSKFPLLNSEYGDLEHLNYKGATKFSNWFSTLLENQLLEKSDIEAFVNNEINKMD